MSHARGTLSPTNGIDIPGRKAKKRRNSKKWKSAANSIDGLQITIPTGSIPEDIGEVTVNITANSGRLYSFTYNRNKASGAKPDAAAPEQEPVADQDRQPSTTEGSLSFDAVIDEAPVDITPVGDVREQTPEASDTESDDTTENEIPADSSATALAAELEPFKRIIEDYIDQIKQETPEESLAQHEETPLLDINSDPESLQPPRESWGSWTKRMAYQCTIGAVKATGAAIASSASTAYKKIVAGVVYAKQHPKDAAIDSLKELLAFIATLPAAINALMLPSGKTAKDLGEAWWNAMSLLAKLNSLVNAFSSVYVNLPQNIKFVLEAWTNVRAKFQDTFKGIRSFFENTLSTISGVCSGIAAGSIALGTFSFLLVYLAISFSTIPLVINAASRFIGTIRAFNRMHNFFNKDANTQRKLIDALKHVKEDYKNKLETAIKIKSDRLIKRHLITQAFLEQHWRQDAKLSGKALEAEINLQAPKLMALLNTLPTTPDDTRATTKTLLKNANLDRAKELLRQHLNAEWNIHTKPLVNKDYVLIFKNLANTIAQLEQPQAREAQSDAIHIINEKSRAEYIKEYALTMVDIIFTLSIVAIPTYFVFMQLGYNGFNALHKFFISGTVDSKPSDWDKNLDVWWKRAIGFIPGLASSTLYGITAMDFREVVMNTAIRLYRYPSQIISTLVWLATNYFASSSMESVGKSVVTNPNNILGEFMTADSMQTTLPLLMRLSGGIVNWTPEAKQMNKEAPKKLNEPTLQEVINKLGDPNEIRISERTAKKIRTKLENCSFFNTNSDYSPAQESDDPVTQTPEAHYPT